MTEIVDGNVNFIQGQDASKQPDVIGASAYAAGINVTAHEGDLKPRWGIDKISLDVQDGGVKKKNQQTKSYKTIYRTGKYQGSHEYVIGGVSYIIAVIGGTIFATHPERLTVSVIEIDDGTRISEKHDRVNISVADKYLVIHDYPAYPVILDGFAAYRSSSIVDESGNVIGVPISVDSTYSQNRLFIMNEGDEFTAGDPAGATGFVQAPVSFEEILLSGSNYFGQVFSLPTGFNKEKITACTFLPVVDTSTGIGPLLISTRRQVFAFNAQSQRSTWENGRFGSLFMQDPGLAGPRAFDFLNSDLIYLGSDGSVRTMSMSRQQQNRWSKVSISEEVKNWLKYWDKDLIKFAAVTVFRNKVFITANPYRTPAKTLNDRKVFDYAHGGMVVLELDNMTSFGETGAPTWAGLWTGVRPMDFIKVQGNLYIYAKDSNRINTLYKVNPDRTYDTDGENIRQVKSIIYTRDYFSENKLSYKSLENILLNIQNVKGDFSIEVLYKPSHGEVFKPFGYFEHCAPWRSLNVFDINNPFGFKGHNFSNMLFCEPPDIEGSLVNQDLYDYFSTMQFKINITGIHWALKSLRVLANAEPENRTESIINAQENGRFNSPLIPLDKSKDWQIPEFSVIDGA